MRPEENVVVLVHAGMPFKRARMFPAVPAVVVARALVPLPYGMAPDWIEAQPVPPEETGSVPVTSFARLTSAVPTTPALALRKPEREPSEKFDANKLVEEAVVLKKVVEVAFVRVAPPDASIENRFVSELFFIWKRFAV